MLAVPAVLLFKKDSVPPLLMIADPALALFWNFVVPPTENVALAPFWTEMPAPVKVMSKLLAKP
jgi:hypothetical protein